MNFNVKGKVVQVFPPRTGVSQRGPWGSQQLVIEVLNGTYTEKLVIENRREYEKFGRIPIGATIDAKCSVTSREWNGKWFTSVECFEWKEDVNDAPY